MSNKNSNPTLNPFIKHEILFDTHRSLISAPILIFSDRLKNIELLLNVSAERNIFLHRLPRPDYFSSISQGRSFLF